MHGMFFDFPKTFAVANSHGLRPIGSHLRYVPDFCGWNDRLVLATDETSIQGNHLAGQPQSNLWFGRYEDLKTWGPANGYGGPWVDDEVRAGDVVGPISGCRFSTAMFAPRGWSNKADGWSRSSHHGSATNHVDARSID